LHKCCGGARGNGFSFGSVYLLHVWTSAAHRYLYIPGGFRRVANVVAFVGAFVDLFMIIPALLLFEDFYGRMAVICSLPDRVLPRIRRVGGYQMLKANRTDLFRRRVSEPFF
jgi:hypothetical protein